MHRNGAISHKCLRAGLEILPATVCYSFRWLRQGRKKVLNGAQFRFRSFFHPFLTLKNLDHPRYGRISRQALKKPAPLREAGFSLVELMVTVGLLSILAAIGTGSIVQNLPNYRLRGAARDLVSNFQKAKIEAAKRNTRVILVFTYGDGASGKYQICTDRNNDNDCDEADEEQLLEIEMPQEITLYNTGATPFGAGKPDNVTGFTSRGFPVAIGSVMLKNDLSRYYKVSISMAGFVKLYTSSDGSTWN